MDCIAPKAPRHYQVCSLPASMSAGQKPLLAPSNDKDLPVRSTVSSMSSRLYLSVFMQLL